MNPPSRAVRTELEGILQADETLVGEVFRRPQFTGREIMEELGKKTPGFVANYRAVIAAILEADTARARPYAPQTRGAIRSLLRRGDLSSGAASYLEGVLTELPETHPKSRNPKVHVARAQPSSAGSLRAAVEHELVERVRALASELHDEGVDADEYWTIVTSHHPLDRLDELVLKEPRGRTFDKLAARGRLDLTLEARLVSWSTDLPFRSSLVDHARGRVDYYSR